MCGIAGVVDFRGAEAHRPRLVRAARAMAHRGPDGEGFHVEGPVGLAHRRLSILDLGGGAQPMFNDDRSIAIVFNGEIYNYVELREELRARYAFRTTSDTEVLLRLYEDRGESMLSELRGMFAFALWDAREGRLFAARDRFGEKPFLYAHAGGRLAFASELDALRVLAGDMIGGTIDPDALDEYLRLLYVPAPRSILRGVRKLPAGHALRFDASGLRVVRYDAPPIPGSGRASPDDARETRRLLEDAVRIQLRSDVPVGALLSGGLDSSVVVALMARLLGKPVRTYSVGFGRDDDELPHARRVAERYGTDHTEIVLTDDVETRVDRALAAYAEPLGDSSAVPTVAVFDAVAKHVKVVLTGDGGDELFAGYDRYREVLKWPHVPGAGALARLVDRAQRVAPASRSLSRARRLGQLCARDPDARQRALVEVFGAGERARLTGRASAPPTHAEGAREEPDRAIHDDLVRYLPDDLMLKTDIAAMAASVESRCPLLDPELARFVLPLPWTSKQDRWEGKLLLKQAARDLLPPEILARRKRGFGSPVEAWLSGPLRARFLDALTGNWSPLREVLDRHVVAEVAHAVAAGRGNAHQGWALFALAAWMRR
ncbi:MAG: asparagine synthase (glutamine-hydrolyzing) [Sandaracinaceae bacterium]